VRQTAVIPTCAVIPASPCHQTPLAPCRVCRCRVFRRRHRRLPDSGWRLCPLSRGCSQWKFLQTVWSVTYSIRSGLMATRWAVNNPGGDNILLIASHAPGIIAAALPKNQHFFNAKMRAFGCAVLAPRHTHFAACGLWRPKSDDLRTDHLATHRVRSTNGEPRASAPPRCCHGRARRHAGPPFALYHQDKITGAGGLAWNPGPTSSSCPHNRDPERLCDPRPRLGMVASAWDCCTAMYQVRKAVQAGDPSTTSNRSKLP